MALISRPSQKPGSNFRSQLFNFQSKYPPLEVVFTDVLLFLPSISVFQSTQTTREFVVITLKPIYYFNVGSFV